MESVDIISCYYFQMESVEAQSNLALWLTSDISNKYLRPQLDQDLRRGIDFVRSHGQNSFSVGDCLLALTQCILRQNRSERLVCGSLRSWLAEIQGHWTENTQCLRSELLQLATTDQVLKVVILFGEPDDTVPLIPVNKTQFLDEIMPIKVMIF